MANKMVLATGSCGGIGTAFLEEAHRRGSAKVYAAVRNINSAKPMVAELTNQFEKRCSIKTIKEYKPHPNTNRLVLHNRDVALEEVSMVAAHAWEPAGAQNVRLQIAVAACPGTKIYSNVEASDCIVNNLLERVEILKHAESGVLNE